LSYDGCSIGFGEGLLAPVVLSLAHGRCLGFEFDPMCPPRQSPFFSLFTFRCWASTPRNLQRLCWPRAGI